MTRKLKNDETVISGLRMMPRPYRILAIGIIFSAIAMLLLLAVGLLAEKH